MEEKVENSVLEEKKPREVKLKSEMYHHEAEKLAKRDDGPNDAVMWGFVIGFALFFVLLLIVIIFVK